MTDKQKYKNFPRYQLSNKGYVEAVEDFIHKQNPYSTDAEVQGIVDDVLKAAGFFNSKNKRAVPSKRSDDGNRR